MCEQFDIFFKLKGMTKVYLIVEKYLEMSIELANSYQTIFAWIVKGKVWKCCVAFCVVFNKLAKIMSFYPFDRLSTIVREEYLRHPDTTFIKNFTSLSFFR